MEYLSGILNGILIVWMFDIYDRLKMLEKRVANKTTRLDARRLSEMNSSLQPLSQEPTSTTEPRVSSTPSTPTNAPVEIPQSTTTTAPQVVIESSVEMNDLDKLFIQEVNRKQRSVEEIRNMAKELGEEPVRRYTTRGYATNNQLEEVAKQHSEWKSKVLSRADELEVVSTFKQIEGMRYSTALEYVKEQGHLLHPLFVESRGPLRRELYDGKVLGVRISDPEFDYQEKKPSGSAVVLEVIDVGGQNINNRG